MQSNGDHMSHPPKNVFLLFWRLQQTHCPGVSQKYGLNPKFFFLLLATFRKSWSCFMCHCKKRGPALPFRVDGAFSVTFARNTCVWKQVENLSCKLQSGIWFEIFLKWWCVPAISAVQIRLQSYPHFPGINFSVGMHRIGLSESFLTVKLGKLSSRSRVNPMFNIVASLLSTPPNALIIAQ